MNDICPGAKTSPALATVIVAVAATPAVATYTSFANGLAPKAPTVTAVASAANAVSFAI